MLTSRSIDALSEELERTLGDPGEPAAAISFQRAVELDEREAYPDEACCALDAWGLAAHYVPRSFGGQLDSYAELLDLVRTVARRDLTVAVTHGISLLGAGPVWAAGTPAQRERVSGLVRGGARVACALTEAAHGADLLGSELAASPCEGGFLLRGEKWLINSATRSAALTVFARTDPRGGPRGFSFLLADKERLAPVSFAYLPKEATHGVRGADVSGIRFDGAFLPADSLVGEAGHGFEIALKILQLTRTLAAALSLGASDTALRIAMDFAVARRLYDGTVYDLGAARRALACAFVDLLVCDCVAVSACRSIHASPGQLSVVSPIVKYLVPVVAEDIVRRAAAILGARYYLRTGHASGVFQKLLRDNAVVSLFDGSTAVNLHGLVLQLDLLLAGAALDRPSDAGRLRVIFSPDAPLPSFDYGDLRLSSRGRNDVVEGAVANVASVQDARGVSVDVCDRLRPLLALIPAEARRQQSLWRSLHGRSEAGFARSAAAFSAARQYARLHAACACVGMWQHTGADQSWLRSGEWLVIALHRLLGRPNGAPEPPHEMFEAVEREMLDRFQRRIRFGIAAKAHA